MSDVVRWGIFGTGRISHAFATALKDTPGAVLAGVASRSIESAQQFGSEFGAPASFGSYEALAASDAVDIIYIGSPHTMHAENTITALSGGKAVLCEKPFTLNRGQAERVVALAREKKLFLMEAMWTRFMPALAEVRRIVASGEIGEVHQLHADFGIAATRDPEHRVNNPALGGGALLDLGIYPLSLAAALLGPVKSVNAVATLGATGVDEQTAFTLLHAGGGMSVCSCSLRARTGCELTISGTLGHVRMNSMFHVASSVTVKLANGEGRTVDTPFIGNGYVHEALEAGRCLRAGLLESPGMTQDETLALMGLMDSIRAQIGLRYPGD